MNIVEQLKFEKNKAERAANRYKIQYEKLLKIENLSPAGNWDLGYTKAKMDSKLEIVDILSDMLKIIEEN